MRKVIEKCPACGDELVVTQLRCHGCETEVHGQFSTSLFCKLSPEDLAFAEMFIRLRGNVREMERELGVAYNAVRNRLDEVIERLGFEADSPPSESRTRRRRSRTRRSLDRASVLNQLERGDITPDQAEELLRGESPTDEEAEDE